MIITLSEGDGQIMLRSRAGDFSPPSNSRGVCHRGVIAVKSGVALGITLCGSPMNSMNTWQRWRRAAGPTYARPPYFHSLGRTGFMSSYSWREKSKV